MLPPRPQEDRVSSTSHPFPSIAPDAERGAWTYACVVVFVGVLMAGGEVVWGRGILLALIGLAVILRPPERLPGKFVGWALLAFLVSLATGFLPWGTELSGVWRAEATARGIELPATLSVHPLRTAETLGIAFAAVVWLVWLCDLPTTRKNRQYTGACLAIGTSVLAGVLIIAEVEGLRYPLAPSTHVFSYFPNKNQTALMLCLGGIFAGAGVLTCGVRKPRMAAAGIVGVVLCFVGIGLCDSRAAQFLMIAGLLVLTLITSVGQGRAATLRSSLPVLLIVLVAAIVSGSGRLRETLFGNLGQEDMRFLLWQDVLTLFREQPVFGIGLGTFRHVFWQYRDVSISTSEALHPDSDVFWLLAETGVVGILAAAVLLFVLLRQLFPLQMGRTGRFRVAALVAVFAFLLHAVVDVGGHRLGTVLAGMLIFAVARRSAFLSAGAKIPVWTIRGVGVLLLLIGLAWTAAGIFRLPWESSVIVAAGQEAFAEMPANSAAEVNRLLAIEPMNWAHYVTAGRAAVAVDNRSVEQLKLAQQRFRQAQFLQPVLAEPLMQEAMVWEKTAPSLALNAWREALERQPQAMQRHFLGAVARNPAWQDRLTGFLKQFPELRIAILLRLPQPAFGRELEVYLRDYADFVRVDADSMRGLFAKAIRENEVRLLKAYFDGLDVAGQARLWEERARLKAATGDYSGAVELALELLPLPEFLQGERRGTLPQLFGNYRSRPSDILLGLTLLRDLIEARDYARAKVVTQLLTVQQNSPPAAYYWRGVLLAEDDPEAAWAALEKYLEVRGKL